MPRTASPVPAAASPMVEGAAQPLRDLLEGLGRLLAASPDAVAFYAEFLQRVLAALGGDAGAVWGRGPQGDFRIEYQTGREALGLDAVPEAREAHEQALHLAAERRQPFWLPPRGTGPGNRHLPAGNPTEWGLFLAPILVEGQVAGLVEVWRKGALEARVARSLARVLGEVTGFAAAYLHRTRCEEFKVREELWGQLQAHSRRLHGTLDAREAAYLAANDGRQLLGCDRVSVVVNRRGKAELLATSGAPFIEARAPLPLALRTLGEAVLTWGEPVLYTGAREEGLPPQVLAALDLFLAESKSRLLVALPLRDGRQKEDERPCAVLVAECFTPPPSGSAAAGGGQGREAEPLRARMESLAPDTATALYNALRHEQVPLRRLSDPLARLRDWLRPRGLAKVAVVAGALLVLAATLTLVHAPLRLEARGALLPRERQVVYSTLNGKVVELKAQHGTSVAKGQELLLMEDLDLHLQIEQLTLKVSSAEQRLALLSQQLGRATGNEERNTLTRELVNQEYEMRKAAAERDVLLQGSRNPRRAPVLSPLAGKVVTFDAQEQLLGKTVKPGDPLLRVARVEGAWEVELYIPEERVGPVREGLAAAPRGELDVQLLLASHPHRTFRAVLLKDGLGGETTVKDNAVVLPARLRLTDRDLLTQLEGMPVGVEVRAKIDCGRRPVGYVWFADLWEFLCEHVLF
jgi:multidrug efflux pump subunit AcrA (membrane-fusion protein)